MEEEESRYEYLKRHGICPRCKGKARPGRVYCAECARKSHEYHQRHKAAPRNPKRDYEYGKTYRKRHEEQGLCICCPRPAKHGKYCEYHWRRNIERSRKQHPSQQKEPRSTLPVPKLGRSSKYDLPKVIALYNAGWPYWKIEEEVGMPRGTIGYYINKAKEQANE